MSSTGPSIILLKDVKPKPRCTKSILKEKPSSQKLKRERVPKSLQREFLTKKLKTQPRKIKKANLLRRKSKEKHPKREKERNLLKKRKNSRPNKKLHPRNKFKMRKNRNLQKVVKRIWKSPCRLVL